jgi:hypothetical protein
MGKRETAFSGEYKREPVQFMGEDFILPFQPFELNHEYSVLYTIQKGEVMQTLKQNFSVRRLRSEVKQDDFYFIQIDKISEPLIDGKTIDITAYNVAEKTARLVYPLRIVVDKYGKWVEINSYDKLKERWEKQKDEIKDFYDGLIYEILANNVEEAIEDNDSLIQFMSSNWFLRAFFNGIHAPYTRKFEIEKKLYFPAIAEVDDIEFSIAQKVNPYLNELQQIEVTQIGETENEYINGSFRANYFINPNNYIVQNLDLECKIAMSTPRNISLRVRNLDQKTSLLDSGITPLV